MAVLTIRMPETKVERLKAIAEQRKISVNKLVEEWAAMAIAAFDVESRFRARAARGSAARGKSLLAELDAYYGSGPGGAPVSNGLHEPPAAAYEHLPPSTNKKPPRKR